MLRSKMAVLAGLGLIAVAWPAAAQSNDPASRPAGQSTQTTADNISSRATAAMPERPNAAWFQAGYTGVEQSTAGAAFDGSLTNLIAGYDRFVTSRVLLGVAVTFESLDIDTNFLSGRGSLENTGFGLAPYVGVKLDDTWSVDLSAGYSWLDYDVRGNNNTVAGSFDAERWFVNSNLSAVYRSGNWRFLPKVGVLYMKEDQDGYVQSNGVAVAQQDIRLGRAYAGGRIGYATETMMPYLRLQGEYDFKHPGRQAIGNGQFTSEDDTGGQIGAGIEFFSTGPWSGAVELAYNSLGRQDLDVWNALARIRMSF